MSLRVLVTGAAGSLGTVVVRGLADLGHDVAALDRVPAPDGPDWDWFAGEWFTGDCADPSFVDHAVASAAPDAVVHLAGYPDELDASGSLTSHTLTTVALLDAMVAHDVRRLVYASSNHAVGRTPHEGHSPTSPVGVHADPRPDTFYGVAKVAAEAVMRLYADRYGLDLVACRIGSFLPRPLTRRHLATWLSPDDCVRMVHASLTAESPGFQVLYGISANTRAWWDLAPGRALGYHPLDDAESHAADLPDRAEDAFEDRYVGGPFVGERFHRPGLGN